MKQYFTDQLQTANPITTNEVTKLLTKRAGLFTLDNSTELNAFEDLKKYYESTIGKKKLYYLLDRGNGRVDSDGSIQTDIELLYILEDEFDTLSGLEFVKMESDYPRFKHASIRLPIIKNVKYMEQMARGIDRINQESQGE